MPKNFQKRSVKKTKKPDNFSLAFLIKEFQF
jgi:hypothetical protein